VFKVTRKHSQPALVERRGPGRPQPKLADQLPQLCGADRSRGYWAAAAIVRAAAAGRYARRKVRMWRTASGILSGVSFHG
jgi:hypothetical protein